MKKRTAKSGGTEKSRSAKPGVHRQAEQIDLVILDMIRPRKGGRETFLKLQEINPKVPVLFSTGYSQNDKVNEILALGVRGFIQKPYQVRDLLAKVREILDGKS